MHFMGFVIVDWPTEEAVDAAMSDHYEKEWDWYRCGGRWDGFFGGDAEMDRRSTHGGFNFDDKNSSAAGNACPVAELKTDGKLPYFFVVDGDWVPRKRYDESAENPALPGFGVDAPDYEAKFREALDRHRDKWVVVVDVHN